MLNTICLSPYIPSKFMGMFDKFKKKNRVLEPDKYAEKIPYVGITKREFMMTTDIQELEKNIEKNVNEQIKKSMKMNKDELKSMYDEVMDTKHSFVDNANTWSRTGLFAKKMDLVVHGYEKLRDELQNEIKKQN